MGIGLEKSEFAKKRMTININHQTLAGKITDLFANIPQVEAVALGGSTVTSFTDTNSDIDLYVYTRAEIPLTLREEIVQLSGGASKTSLGMNYWGPNDEWYDLFTGIEVDIIYFDHNWMEDKIRRIIEHGQPSLGYSTCMWHIVKISQVQYDPNGWFQNLQQQAQAEYPDILQKNIINLNYPVLRTIIPAYTHQLEKAVKRGDLVSVNHRLAALFASYFDIIFALNHVLHPGEKRLTYQAQSLCKKLPINMVSDITSVIRLSCVSETVFIQQLNDLLDRLDILLEQEGFGQIIKVK